VQTPQVFRRAALEPVLFGSDDRLLAAASDDAWLIEQAGGVVRVCDAGPQNIKITTGVDLRLADMLLRDRIG
jgi:2-C-methyl-D-erythritol 4-phosphate cytidylyltransferase